MHQRKSVIMALTTLLIIVCCLAVSSCVTLPVPPDNPNNICNIFQQYPKWYWTASQARHQWKIPISTQMAVMYYESAFIGNAKPPRKKLFGAIPWRRPSTAYGYSQALDHTWELYQRQTGNHDASRDNFSDAIDFMAWYLHRAHILAGIPNNDSYSLYLAYHEGVRNYKQGSYRHKAWLMNVAHKVERRAHRYRSQLLQCENHLPAKPWWYK